MSLEVRDSIIHGRGVFTTAHIPKHSVICRVNIVRQVTDEHPLNPDKGELEHHCHWYPDGTTVLVGEPHCYLNHSCKSNVFYYTINKIGFLLSMREILENEELTLDYSLCNFDGQVWECRCGSSNCRRRHRCGFKYMTESQQMEYLPYLDPCIVKAFSESIQDILDKKTISE